MKKEVITVEVKNGSILRATARGYGDLVSSDEIRQEQKQVSLDRFLVKVAQKQEKSTDSSDSVSDNESCPTQ
jgi:hypothetical protein